MKRRFTTILSAVIILAAGCAGHNAADTADRAARLREKILSCDTSTVLVAAHRGDWRYAPENSIAAIEHSIKSGVDIVELDLQLTKDSVLILMHDSKLDRTTTGKGKVCDWTLDSIRTLKLKNGCGIRTKHPVPTLEEALAVTKGKVLVNLDKADRYFGLVMETIGKTGTSGQIIMKGKKPAEEIISTYGKYLDDVIYMPIVDLDAPGAEESLGNFSAILSPAAYELLFADGNDTDMPETARRELRGKSLIWYNTLWDTLCGGHDDDMALENPDKAYGYLIDSLGARIIQTDRAEYLLEYLRARGLHE